MFMKKSPVVLCTSSNLPTFIWPSVSTTSSLSPLRPAQHSSNTPSPRRPRCGEISRTSSSRRYATVSDKFPKRSETSVSHNDWPSGPHPTPYQIFDQKRDAPYSKARFYTLVKIYHPDRHIQTGKADSLSHAVRLERYRLVVAANQILSDPTRKRAYDLYGAGWGSKLSMDNSAYRHAEKSWRNEPGNPSMNATWEDWERWYGERNGDKAKQQTVFMSNEMFVVVLCAFVLAGSLGNARRANKSTISLVEMQDQKHEAISQDVRMRKTEQIGLSRHERVESFLRQREGWNIPVHPPPQDTHGK
ncbi:hypothetical protein PG996_002759 [Apiospora saccharicola]|uniref:J domain-containing protein n=1 Tax=Apiospora saccharicola TaxID=335842 RepID=A0ABR1WKI6_9PEZI